MQIRRVVIPAVALAVMLGGCSPANGPSETPMPPSESPGAPVITSEAPTSPPPTKQAAPTPTPSETLDADQTAAVDALDEFFELVNAMSKDPELPLQPLADVTTGRTQETYVRTMSEDRAQGLIQIGDLEWSVVDVGSVEHREGEKVVVVTACTDNSGTDLVVAETGESVLDAERPAIVRWEVDVVTLGPSWRVSDISNAPVDECA